MKKMYLIMSIIFIIITFASIFFAFTSFGEFNAGYTVIPMLITLSFSSAYRKELKKQADKPKESTKTNNNENIDETAM